MKKELILASEADSDLLGRKIASLLPNGGFVALYGNLGSGKTVIARGIAAQLGITNISSPTFTILQRYDTEPVLYHIDAYRLSNEDELYDVGYEECLGKGNLTVMEWADIVPNALPDKRIDLHLEGSGSEPRKAIIVCRKDILTEEQAESL